MRKSAMPEALLVRKERLRQLLAGAAPALLYADHLGAARCSTLDEGCHPMAATAEHHATSPHLLSHQTRTLSQWDCGPQFPTDCLIPRTIEPTATACPPSVARSGVYHHCGLSNLVAPAKGSAVHGGTSHDPRTLLI
jgi:hypothetical protein